MWLDAYDTSTITLTSNTRVTGWRDKAQGFTLGQVVNGVTAPNYSNAQRGIYFTNPTNGIFTSNVTQGLGVVNPPISVNFTQQTHFTVIQPLGGTSGYAQVLRINSESGPTFGFLANNVNAFPSEVVSDNFTILTSIYASYLTTKHIRSLNIQPDGHFIYLNGTQGGLTVVNYSSPNTLALTSLSLGGHNDNRSYSGFIFESIYYNRVLTLEERQQIEGYLAWKWDLISSLPLNHPYRKRPLVPFSSSILPLAIRLNKPDFYINPQLISGLALWLDAADQTTVTLSGTNVTQWADKSINLTNAVAGALTYPSYQSKTLNELPVITMRGTNDYFLVSNNFSPAQYPSLCYYIVMRVANSQSTNFAGVLSTHNGTTWGRSLGLGNSGTSLQQGYFGNLQNIVTCVKERWLLVSLQFVTTVSAIMYQNGVATNAFASPTGTNATGFKIGSYSSAGSYATYNANFDVAEILVYGANQTISERQSLEGYLAWKWGLLTNLPVTHPFRNGPLAPFRGLTLPASLKVTSWKPTQIIGCQLWLDAADSTSLILSGINVSQWKDKSGNARNFSQATSSQQPTYPGKFLLFDGVDDLLTGPNFVPVYSNPSIFNVFIVGNALTISLNNANPYDNEAFIGDSGGYHSIFVKTNTVGGYYYNSGNATLQTTQAYTANTLGIFNISLQGNLFSLYQNGTVSSVTATLPIKTSGITSLFQLGAQYATAGGFNRYLNCRIYEVVIYNTSLTSAGRQQVEGYLAWKWGLVASLPSTHPYKLFPPSP